MIQKNKNLKNFFVLKYWLFTTLFLSSHVVAAMPNSLANPASGYCIQVGGKLEILKREDGAEYGVCLFEDNKKCEEWALFRGECPIGGVKTDS